MASEIFMSIIHRCPREGGRPRAEGCGRWFTAPGENSGRTSTLLTPGVGRRPGKTGLEGQNKGWWRPWEQNSGVQVCWSQNYPSPLGTASSPQACVGNSEASVFGPQFYPESSWHGRLGVGGGDVQTELGWCFAEVIRDREAGPSTARAAGSTLPLTETRIAVPGGAPIAKWLCSSRKFQWFIYLPKILQTRET